MDPTICSLSSLDCSKFTDVCEPAFFDDPRVVTYVQGLESMVANASAPTFCSVTSLGVYLPCGSVNSFGQAIDSVTKSLDVVSLQSQYTKTTVRQCLTMATAIPSITKIKQLYASKRSPWLMILCFGLALVGILLAIVRFRRARWLNIVGLTFAAAGLLLGMTLLTGTTWKL